jgi:Fe2+ transport system protein B
MSELTLPARVALVGNPNSGKTALFNALTGSRQKVANYPGVTAARRHDDLCDDGRDLVLCSVPPAPADAPEPAINYSLAARIGQAMEPVLRPLGFNWQIDVALVPGMAAREVAVAALGTVYSIAGADETVPSWAVP